ncbi:hypothetical protein [Methylopila sp. Yamaguchi]|uniref:hypothetical protein n=1 Tax=Methylopila sp. Yamaguchi TaxID=1437817 RepID=UPI0011AF0DCB|nr:hypothetical protein [Methylopila sp. Yamaguchi]
MLVTSNEALKLTLSLVAVILVAILIFVPAERLTGTPVGDVIFKIARSIRIDPETLQAKRDLKVAEATAVGDQAAETAVEARGAIPTAVQDRVQRATDAALRASIEAQRAGAPAAFTGNAVVFGADRLLRDAINEVTPFTGARIFRRQGFYRSVLPVATSDAAQMALSQMRAKIPDRAPYLVDLAKWCPSPRQETENGVPITDCP